MWQFKILHGIHNTRRNLKKWRIINDNTCELCQENAVEGTDHYFLLCSFNNNLLQNIYEKISHVFETRVTINDVEFVTGLWSITSEDKNLLALDKMLFLGRMFLIKNRRSRQRVNIDNFLEFTIEQLDLEKNLKEFRPSKLFNNIAWDFILQQFSH